MTDIKTRSRALIVIDSLDAEVLEEIRIELEAQRQRARSKAAVNRVFQPFGIKS